MCIRDSYWMVISSFKGQTEIFNNSLLPSSFSADNYAYALEQVDILGMTVNTFFMAISQAVLQLATAIMAAYALTRWKFPGSRVIYTLFALTWLVPIQATMIPNYTTLVNMGFRDSIVGVIIPNMAVSYTHLDVYKRQREDSSAKQTVTPPPPAVTSPARSRFQPVSSAIPAISFSGVSSPL